jgi:hypothetical protein
MKTVLVLLLLSTGPISLAQKQKVSNAIYSGIPWFDDNGNVVSAHGACVVKEGDRYFLFGEKHSDTSNAFAGFNCYFSTDLYNWKFERVALPVQESGKLGPNRVGERPKVMKCPSTGEYVMYMHVDTLGYVDQFVGYATSKNITGPYQFKGALLFNGKPIKKWDMGAFQDKDGSGYILLHGGDIFKLSDDYKSISQHVNKAFEKGFESPAIFRKDSLYYFLGSGLTGWERNDNSYFTATSLKGPWTKGGWFAPEGKLTWNSQTTFVLPIVGSKETTYMFMGDRWSFPRQASAATCVWQPLTVSGTSLSIPAYHEAWRINTSTGEALPLTVEGKTIQNTNKRFIHYSEQWQQDTLAVRTAKEKGAACTVTFTGTQIGLYGLARPDGGYASVVLRDSKRKIVLSSTVDMYCQYPVSTLKLLSPVLPKDTYTLSVSVIGESWYWVLKSGRRTGSKGNVVSLDKIIVNRSQVAVMEDATIKQVQPAQEGITQTKVVSIKEKKNAIK